MDDGKSITLAPWQRAALAAWWEDRADVSTLGISCPKKVGKTTTNSLLVAWRWLALPGAHLCIANDFEQSMSRVFAMVAEMVRRNPYLAENVKAGKSELVFTPTGSTLTALASDYAGAAGANFLTSSSTEVWGIQYESSVRLWEELTPVPGRFFGLPCLRIADSYAGFASESKVWHKLIDRGLAGKSVSKRWPLFKVGELLLFHIEGVEDQKRCFRGTDCERTAYYAEQIESLRPNAYARMHLNQRANAEGAFVTDEQWQGCFSRNVRSLQEGEQVELFFGADASTTHDFTALVGTQKMEDGVDVRFVRVWKPKSIAGMRLGKPSVDLEATIGAEVLRLHKAGQVKSICYDPWQMATVARQWEKAGVRCVEMPQTAQRTEADTALYNDIVSGRIRHGRNTELDEAVRNAVISETPRGIRIVKEKAVRKIDALVALSMSNHAAVTQQVAILETGPNPFYDNDDDFDEHEVRKVDFSKMRRTPAGNWVSDLVKRPVNNDGPVRYS